MSIDPLCQPAAQVVEDQFREVKFRDVKPVF
jgi:hypothetical protein